MEENKDVLVSIGEKYMLTIKEAGAYFNIGIKNEIRSISSSL